MLPRQFNLRRGASRVFGSLAFRVLIFLSLALLPLGLIAVDQTLKLGDASERRLEASLLASTTLAAKDERALVQGALGASEALSVLLPPLSTDREDCDRYLQRYIADTGKFVFAGLVSVEGDILCSWPSSDANVSHTQAYKSITSDTRSGVHRSDLGVVSGIPVVIATYPIATDGEFKGYTAVSIAQDTVRPDVNKVVAAEPLNIVTFNHEGELLSSFRDQDDALALLPREPLNRLRGDLPGSFRETGDDGREYIFTTLPIVQNNVFALGTWDADQTNLSEMNLILSTSLFPVAMWITSLGVAYFALNRMALRHISRLRAEMKSFAINRTVPSSPPDIAVPREIVDMEDDFRSMAQSLLQDEAIMENAMREKSILVKEVHHRVKNNLQLISSIMNMHMRQVESSETKNVLKRLQERVLGLATIHRTLYQANDLGALDAAALLGSVIEQMRLLASAPGLDVDVQMNLYSVTIYPDQAVPLSLFASEAITNALKYVGQPETGAPWIKVELKQENDTDVTFAITNSGGPPISSLAQISSSQLGSRLLKAFTQQLGGTTDVTQTERSYRVEIRFPLEDFKADVVDY